MVYGLSESKLEEFLRKGKDWSRLKTSLQGVFVLKLPQYRSSPPRLAVELNPVDESGKPTKRRGLILRSTGELEEFKKLFDYEKLSKLLGMLESVNPKVEAKKKGREEPVLEL